MTTVRTWLDFALLQTAAESYLNDISLESHDQLTQLETRALISARLQGDNKNPDPLRNPLGLGGNTKYTEQQATWFLGRKIGTPKFSTPTTPPARSRDVPSGASMNDSTTMRLPWR